MNRNNLFPLSVLLITLFATTTVGSEKRASEALEDSIFAMRQILDDSNNVLSDVEKTIKNNEINVNNFLANINKADSKLQEIKVKSDGTISTKKIKRALILLQDSLHNMDSIERNFTDFKSYVIGGKVKLEKSLKKIKEDHDKLKKEIEREKELEFEDRQAIINIMEAQLYLTIGTQYLIIGKIGQINDAKENVAMINKEILEELYTIEPHKETIGQLLKLENSKDQANFTKEEINILHYIDSLLKDLTKPIE